VVAVEATASALPVVRTFALIATPLPVEREFPLTVMTVARVVDTSSIWKPLPAPVRIPLKLKRTIPFPGLAVTAEVRDIKELVEAVLDELMVKIFMRSAVPESLRFKRDPVAPTAFAPEALMDAREPVKAVMAPDSVKSSKEPVFAPAVVIEVELEAREAILALVVLELDVMPNALFPVPTFVIASTTPVAAASLCCTSRTMAEFVRVEVAPTVGDASTIFTIEPLGV